MARDRLENERRTPLHGRFSKGAMARQMTPLSLGGERMVNRRFQDPRHGL